MSNTPRAAICALLSVLASASGACIATDEDPALAEYEGESVSPSAEQPWSMSIGPDCPATLIAPTWVLASAYCVSTSHIYDYGIPVSYSRTNARGQRTSHTMRAPWSPAAGHRRPHGEDGFQHDVALVKLPQPFPYDPMLQPAMLPTVGPSVGQRGVIAFEGFFASYASPANVVALLGDELAVRTTDGDGCPPIGSPGLVTRHGGVNTLVGVVARPPGPCGQPGDSFRVTNIHEVVSWIRSKGVPLAPPPNTSDLLWRSNTATMEIWDGADAGALTPRIDPGASWLVAGMGDFDGNGRADILWRSIGGHTAIWYDGDPARSGYPGYVDASWAIKAVDDFDGNRTGDILWQRTDGALAIWYSANPAAAGYPGTADARFVFEKTGDFDGNHLADILWRRSDGVLTIWYDGGYPVSQEIATVDSSWTVLATADFDANGRSDILWRHTSNSLAIWPDADPARAQYPGTVVSTWSLAATGDFDGNGRSDLVWRNAYDKLYLWRDGSPLAELVLGTVAPSMQLVGVGRF